jgi:hypothetical protein
MRSEEPNQLLKKVEQKLFYIFHLWERLCEAKSQIYFLKKLSKNYFIIVFILHQHLKKVEQKLFYNCVYFASTFKKS